MTAVQTTKPSSNDTFKFMHGFRSETLILECKYTRKDAYEYVCVCVCVCV